MKKLVKLAIPFLIIIGFFVLGSPESNSPTEPEIALAAEVDYFLKIEGVEGEVSRGGEIEILSWSWGETQEAALLLPAVQSAREAANRNSAPDALSQEIDFEMQMSKASPALMQLSASGKRLTEATLEGFRAGDEEPYLIIKMKPVYITSYQTGGSSGDVVPVDTISLNFGAIKFEYVPSEGSKNPGPAVIREWNFDTHSAEY